MSTIEHREARGLALVYGSIVLFCMVPVCFVLWLIIGYSPKVIAAEVQPVERAKHSAEFIAYVDGCKLYRVFVPTRYYGAFAYIVRCHTGTASVSTIQ